MILEQARDNPDQVFNDPEAENNLVDFYNLLYQIDKRANPQLYPKMKMYD
jgi:hypothetical protein